MTSSGGSEGAKLIFDTKDRRELIHDWSPSGKYIVFHVENPAPQRRDLWYIERSQGEWKAQPFVETEAEERVAVFSPDERYLAYVSDESGRDEVYVKPFPSGDNKWQISENGGTQPRWAGDELFFVNGDVLHAARVSVDGEFRVLSTERLFRDPALVNGFAFQTYDVDSDGQRFVLVDTVYDGPASIIHVVLNWGARLVDER